METLEKSRMCRLCGKQSGIAVDIFDKNENHVRKINAILPILVHEMDLLPKQMCHRCSYKLEEFYDFYVDCAKTDSELKSQLSWMSKENLEEKIVTPMVKMNPFKIKTEPPDGDSMDSNVFGKFNENSLFFPASFLQHSFEPTTPIITCSRCQCICKRDVKESKKSKQVKDDQAHSSNIASDLSNKVDRINEPDDSNGLPKFENLKNRALRPRKGSVDYMGHKKKGIASNLRAKLKSTLEMLDSTLVQPVNIKISQNNLTNPSPIIKLEKLDDTIRTIRTRKNLEEFNKRMKEYRKKSREEKSNKKMLQSRKSFQKEFDVRRKSLQNEENLKDFEKKNLQKDSVSRKSVHIEENSTVKSLLLEESEKNNQCSSDSSLKDSSNENVIKIAELRIKQEVVNKMIENNESAEESNLKKSYEVDISSKEVPQNVEKLPMHAIVKLEKDYTCNVDYPRIKIKRHLAVANSSKSQDNTLDSSFEHDSSFEENVNKKRLSKEDGNVSPKVLRSSEKRLKDNTSKDKSRKEMKKKHKQLDFELKRTEKNSCNVQQSDFKRYCEKCNTYFKNKELYQLHPCYQN